MSELWVVSGESGLNEHWIERIFDHEPNAQELDDLDRLRFPRVLNKRENGSTYEVPSGTPGGWAGWRVTKMYEHRQGDFRRA